MLPSVSELVESGVAVAALASVHLFAGRLRFLDVVPRSRWLSAAGGVSVAYVFLHLLPELVEGQEHLAAAREGAWVVGPLEVAHPSFLVALIGLAIFYGLERSVARHRNRAEGAPPGVFWLHIGSFSLYNAIIGYLLLHREDEGPVAMALYAVAMILHFFVTDYGLRKDHKEVYARRGRWVLASVVVGGWLLGVFTEVPEAVLIALMAFVGGGVILNVLKEELPEERESRFGAFAAGLVVYAALLLLL